MASFTVGTAKSGTLVSRLPGAAWLTSQMAAHRRLLPFALVGASGVVVNLAGVWVAMQCLSFSTLAIPRREAVASLAGIVVSVLSNFGLNDRWTWRDRQTGHGWWMRLLRYGAVSAVSGGLQFGVSMLLIHVTPMSIYMAQFLAIGVGTAANYIANNRWTFRAKTSPSLNRETCSQSAEL